MEIPGQIKESYSGSEVNIRTQEVAELYAANSIIDEGDYTIDKEGFRLNGMVFLLDGLDITYGYYKDPIFAASIANPFILTMFASYMRENNIPVNKGSVPLYTHPEAFVSQKNILKYEAISASKFLAKIIDYLVLRGYTREYAARKVAAQRVKSPTSLTFEEACILSLGRSDGEALKLVKDRLVQVYGSIEEVERMIRMNIVDIELTKDPQYIMFQEGANCSTVHDLAKGFDDIMKNYKNSPHNPYLDTLIRPMTNNPIHFGFSIKERSNWKSRRVTEKVGIFPNVYFIPKLAKNGLPSHSILLDAATVFDQDDRITILAFDIREVALPKRSDRGIYDFDDKEYNLYITNRLEDTKKQFIRYMEEYSMGSIV